MPSWDTNKRPPKRPLQGRSRRSGAPLWRPATLQLLDFSLVSLTLSGGPGERFSSPTQGDKKPSASCSPYPLASSD